MNEERVLALAGVFQGVTLAHKLATTGQCDQDALQSSMATVFRIDAPNVMGVYGTLADIKLGLDAIVTQFDSKERDVSIMRMGAMILRLERTFSGRASAQKKLQDGIVETQRQVDHFGLEHPNIKTRLAALYSEIISPLRPRVMVNGQPLYLQQQSIVDGIRSSLLAALRSAVLWHQIGGRQWHMLLQRQQLVALAQGLVTRTTLNGQ